MADQWLQWARKLQSIAQTGLFYGKDPFDLQRYEQVRDVAAEMLAAAADTDAEHVRGICGREFGPGTPKVVVRGAVFRDDRILLVREVLDGRWSLPGGWADVNERPSRAVEREVREEASLEVRAERIFYVHDPSLHEHTRLPFHVYTIFFLCRILAGEPAPGPETTEVGFFPADGLPELSKTRATEAEVAKAFAALRDPDGPALFD